MSGRRTRKEAFRALKLYVVRAIFSTWNQCVEQMADPEP